MGTDYSEDLLRKIEHARSLSKRDFPPLLFNSIPDLLNQRALSDRTYLIYIDKEDRRVELSYVEFCGFARAMARYLKNQGIRKGDRIATISHNHWHTVIQYFAAWLIGAVVVPVNLGEDDDRIRFILENGNVKLAFVRKEYLERIEKIIKSSGGLQNLRLKECDERITPFVEGYDRDPLSDELEGESDALIVYTSGTTGKPKAVLLSQCNLLEDARGISEWHEIDDKTRMMCVLPIHHVNGTVVTLMTPFYQGGSVVLNEKFRVKKFFPIICQEHVHVVSVVPTLLHFLNSEYQNEKKPDTCELRHLICGAGPLTVDTAQRFEEKFHILIVHGYGLSETTCYSCFIPVDLRQEEHNKWMRDYGYPSIGIPIPPNEMQIHDDKGNPLGEKEKGEIVIRGVNVMKEYFGNVDANERAFTYGWFRSGDEGFYIRDEKGSPYFFITGRIKEIIIRGAVNLAPLEIDEVINRAPGVKAGIAVGFENDWYGEEVGAYVQLKDGIKKDPEPILNYCLEHLPFSKSPKVVVFGDQIPVTSTGKYQRMKVAHLFRKWKSTQFKS